MKTRLFLVLFCFFLAASAGGVSYTVTLQPGMNTIANHLDKGLNTLDEVIPAPPDGAVLFKYSCVPGQYTTYMFDSSAGGWVDSIGMPVGGSVTLVPGEGAFLLNPVAAAVTLTFDGALHTPVLPNLPCPCGTPMLISAQRPTFATFETLTGVAPRPGTLLNLWDPATQTYIEYKYVAGGWQPGIPVVPAGQSAFVTLGCDTNSYKWLQPPEPLHQTNLFYGWNQPSMENMPPIAADDWVCTTAAPVTKIRWWGSFLNWQAQTPPVLPQMFRIRFWCDVPKGADPQFPNFSHPGLQAAPDIYCANFTWAYVGQDYDPRTRMYESCFVFEQTLTPQEYFYQEPGPTGTNIYWISIEAVLPVGNYVWGWKTRPRLATSLAPDDAVIFDPLPPMYQPLFWPTPDQSWDLCFELFSTGAGTEFKWYQPPDLREPTQGPPPGVDVDATLYPQVRTNLLADDFKCIETGPITNITIWGSWWHDLLPSDLPTNVIFTLSIHRDVPVPNPWGYSMPGKMLWTRTFGPGQFQCVRVTQGLPEGWFSPTNHYEPVGDSMCFRYDFDIPTGYFVQQGTPTSPVVYWLDVQARVNNAELRFGWKTSTEHWNDDATHAFAFEPFDGPDSLPNPIPWNRLAYPQGHPFYPETLDLAFALNRHESEGEIVKWSQPPEGYFSTDTFNGWNEYSVYGGNQILADDWVCTNSQPVTDIHWWGSFLGWQEPNPPQTPPMYFHISFWTDVPAQPGALFSHPGICLASLICTNYTWTFAGWDIDPRDPLAPPEACFKFEQQLLENEFFKQAPGTNVYWISIAAVYPTGQTPPNPWGWKTVPRNPDSLAPDDAVRIQDPTTPLPGVIYALGSPIWWPEPTNSWDLAFGLTTQEFVTPTNDFGDAPRVYPTLLPAGASHTVVPGIRLGNLIDAEFDGQPNAIATGDDIANLPDEDGVIFATALVPGEVAYVNVTASAAGLLSAWIDYNADGSWATLGDLVFNNVPVGAGINNLSFLVPFNAARGTNTFARFRFSTAGVASFTGSAADGEVEDYQCHIEELEFGDAPDPGFPTLFASNGARHVLFPGIFLGALIDSDLNGQPSPTASGDDLANLPDEDGVILLTPMVPGSPAQVQVTSSAANLLLHAWMDFDGDGSWLQPWNQVFANVPLVAGPNVLNFVVPAGAVPGAKVFARFRLTTMPNISFLGIAPNGEVEDYLYTIHELDFGDAPDPTYPTLLLNNGARHVIGPLYLGARVDSESNGQPNAQASGDDLAGVDDEDGVTFPIALIANSPATIQVVSSGPGLLQGWIDFNGDGIWGPGEQPIVNSPVIPGANPITFFVPNAVAGKSYARFRLSSLTNLTFVGQAPDGEVEDYQVTFYPLKWNMPPELGWEGVDVHDSPALADDFLCKQTGPITDIHFWGSFMGDILPRGGPTNMTITLSIYSDVPAGPLPYSHPGDLKWTRTFNPGSFDAGLAMQTQGEWWLSPPNQWVPFADRNIYQFDFYIPAREAFVQVSNHIYWLEVKHKVDDDVLFGWKTTYQVYQDAACWFTPAGGWIPLVYGDGHPRSNEWMHLSFALSTEEMEQIDWGDAPDPSYPTLAANNGARHQILPTMFLGNLIDAELDGQPNATATGDNLAGLPDEDGVVVPTLVPGQPAVVTVTASAPGLLSAWFDFSCDGSWSEAGDQVFADLPVAGVVNLPFLVPPYTVWGTNVFARFRYSSISNLTYTGYAPDGEVEDYSVTTEVKPQHEVGDAPDSSNHPGLQMTAYPSGGPPGVLAAFPTVWGGLVGLPPFGPYHMQPWAVAYLGTNVTGEWEADQGWDMDVVNNINPLLDKPDQDNGDDAITFPLSLAHGRNNKFAYTYTITSPIPGPLFLNVWFDWNRDGDWNDAFSCPDGVAAPEWAVQNQPIALVLPGVNTGITPQFRAWHPSAKRQPLWMRITLSEIAVPGPLGFSGAGGDGPATAYQYGETEDYYVVEYEDNMELDFGDAPDSPYPTLLPAGARHQVVPGFSLGPLLDFEANGLPHSMALGDDNNNLDDEDGIVFLTPLLVGTQACVNVSLVSGPLGGRLDAWVDFNANGNWEATEQVFTGQPLAAGPNPLCFPVPCNAVLGTNFARFRLTSTGGVSPSGLAQDGEVEDYLLKIQQSAITNLTITNIVVTNVVVGGVTNQAITIRWTPVPACARFQVVATPAFSNTPPYVWTNCGPEIVAPLNSFTETNTWMLEKYYRVIAPYSWP